jgi:hypothetical protein
MGGLRVSTSDTLLDKAIKVCVVHCWHPVTRKWEVPFVPVVYKEVPLFRCIPDRTILRTYADEYESHNRMVLSYIIQRTGESILLVQHDHEHVMLHTPRSYSNWRSTHPFLHRFTRLILHDHEHVTLDTP